MNSIPEPPAARPAYDAGEMGLFVEAGWTD